MCADDLFTFGFIFTWKWKNGLCFEMAVQFKCPVQKLAFETSEDTFSSSDKYKETVTQHYFNHSVRSYILVDRFGIAECCFQLGR